jgi:hypothetical protein
MILPIENAGVCLRKIERHVEWKIEICARPKVASKMMGNSLCVKVQLLVYS